MVGWESSVQSLEHRPTWALATVCFIIISISILLENCIHRLTEYLKRNRKLALCDSVDKVKSELTLLGFMSLILAATERFISKICISSKLADTMLPCRKETNNTTTTFQAYELATVFGRILADSGGASGSNSTATDSCTARGKVPLVTENGIQQLQIFIFVLAIMQVVYSILTVALGRAKMRRWKAWEKETQTMEYLVTNDPNRFRFTRQTTFGRRHETCAETPIQLWLKCFLRQFFRSVAKVDYLTLRHGFLAAHFSIKNNNKFNFNFQKYIKRTLEEDFKILFSIRPHMWFIVVIFMLVDVRGWNVYLWVSYVPLLLVLVIGTKLEVIVARLALQLKNETSVIKGTPLVQPNDDFFWFRSPRFLLNLLHLTLFVNAFELAFFIWVTILFGWGSCYHEHTGVKVTRIVLAVTVQVLCSYITLPLYALVTQMGSQLKGRALEEQAAKIIKEWHVVVREKRKNASTEQTLQSPGRASLSTHLGLRDGNHPVHYPPKTSRTRKPDIHKSMQGEITEEQDEDGQDIS